MQEHRTNWKFKVPGKIKQACTKKNYSSYCHDLWPSLRIPKMPGLARDKQKDMLKHLLEDVLGLPEDSNVWKGLAHNARGVHQLDIYMVTTMDYDDLRGLSYKPSPKAATRSVPKGIATRLINFQKIYGEYNGARKTMVDELLTLTMEELEKYEHDLRKRQVADPNFQVTSPPPTAGRAPSNPMQDFNKGVQQDLLSFRTMKSIEQWDNWHRVFTATTKAQGVSNVLDLRYIPATVAESQLFDAHQTYLYTVLLQTVKTHCSRPLSSTTQTDKCRMSGAISPRPPRHPHQLKSRPILSCTISRSSEI